MYVCVLCVCLFVGMFVCLYVCMDGWRSDAPFRVHIASPRCLFNVLPTIGGACFAGMVQDGLACFAFCQAVRAWLPSY